MYNCTLCIYNTRSSTRRFRTMMAMATATSSSSCASSVSLPDGSFLQNPIVYSNTSRSQLMQSQQFQFPLCLRTTGKDLRLRKPFHLSKIHCTRDPKAPVVTKDSWERSIINSKVPVLVEFYANWCGPCKMVHRVIDEIAVEYAGRLKFYVLNTDRDLQIAEDYDIKAVPVVLLFKDGKKYDSVIGTMPKEFYVSAIERVLSS